MTSILKSRPLLSQRYKEVEHKAPDRYTHVPHRAKLQNVTGKHPQPMRFISPLIHPIGCIRQWCMECRVIRIVYDGLITPRVLHKDILRIPARARDRGAKEKTTRWGGDEASGRDKSMMAGEELDSGERKEWKTKEEREREGKHEGEMWGSLEERGRLVGGWDRVSALCLGMKDNRRGRDEKACKHRTQRRIWKMTNASMPGEG